MTLFADSSAVVTMYADEPGRAPLTAEMAIAVSQVTRVEVPAAIWRKQRTGELTADTAHSLSGDFAADYYGDHASAPRFAVVPVTPAVLDEAARLTAVHGLRAYDAIQLSSAMSARAVDPDCSQFASYDEGLRRAASTEGFRLLPLVAQRRAGGRA